MTTDWVPESRPVPPALAEGFEAERYDENDYRIGLMEPVLKRLDQATLEQLSAILGGYPIAPADE